MEALDYFNLLYYLEVQYFFFPNIINNNNNYDYNF